MITEYIGCQKGHMIIENIGCQKGHMIIENIGCQKNICYRITYIKKDNKI